MYIVLILGSDFENGLEDTISINCYGQVEGQTVSMLTYYKGTVTIMFTIFIFTSGYIFLIIIIYYYSFVM